MDSNLFRFIWKHSRRDQIMILALIVASLPFYWASLDIPKRIINDALQGRAFQGGKTTVPFGGLTLSLPEWLGGGSWTLWSNFDMNQLQLLYALSGLFLLFVVLNGAFKYFINIEKGILGERMLRRLRFELFALMMRFRPEDIRAVKPAEAATMIKDEVEPIGGFIGDAFIQPAFLGTQALTALAFIMVQSVWLGLVALGIVLVQVVVIPRLRREQLRLARERQIVSRQLAGRIGEIVEAAPAVHVHGTVARQEADISSRLGRLFLIRVDLYKRKFAVKYLNNFLAQITPFFFYAIGGYFALKGSLDIGQLVAVIAAYRDLPPPLKELIDWDQQRADVEVKYQQIVSQFTVDQLLPERSGDTTVPSPDAPIRIDGLRVLDRRGQPLLETLSTQLPRPSHVALVGGSGSGRDVLAKVLGRQITDYQGTVRLGPLDLARLSDADASGLIAYAGAEPHLFGGTIRDNIVFALQRCQPAAPDLATLSATERMAFLESQRSGTPATLEQDDWTDYAATGATSEADIDRAIIEALALVGLEEAVYGYGLQGRVETEAMPAIAERILEARRAIRERLTEGDMRRLVEPFDPAAYNTNATIGENLLFGVTRRKMLALSELASDAYVQSILAAEALVAPLSEVGLRVAETVLEITSSMPTAYSLHERFPLIPAEERDDYQRLVDAAAARRGGTVLASSGRLKLIGLALAYIEPRHRLGLIDEALQARILRARESFRQHAPTDYAETIEFYDPDAVMRAASLSDNLLFGRIGYSAPNAEQTVRRVMRETLRELDIEAVVYRVGLDFEVGLGGRQLFAPQRALINLARCLIRRPDILVLDGTLSAFGATEAAAVLERIRAASAGRTLIVTVADAEAAAGYDVQLAFDGPRPQAEAVPETRTPQQTSPSGVRVQDAAT